MIEQFINQNTLKFAVITRESYDSDPVAQELSASPASLTVEGIEMVILSIPTNRVAELAAYAAQVANGVEFELTIGSNKVTLLTHEQALKLVAQYQPTSEQELQ